MPMGRAFRRVPVNPQAQPVDRTLQIPAPTDGWVTNENIAATKKKSAVVLENWFPEFDRVRLRAGATKVATTGGDAITALFTYNQGGNEFLFAATATDVYDMTSLDPDTPPSADVSSRTDGYYSTLQIATSGGEFLYAFNEADSPLLFDGSSWTTVTNVSTPAITGTTSNDTSLLRHGWVYRDRIFMIERDTLLAWYLPVESIGGAASDISLQGVFRRGGTLLFGTTWSIDTGDGADDKCCFFTDQGEVAVYEGANPGDSSDWNLIGVYDLSVPLGKNAHMRGGGVPIIATEEGLVPLSVVFKTDVAALGIAAVSRPIEPDWRREAAKVNAAYPWEVMKWPFKNCAFVSLPHSTVTSPICFVVNLETGAWAKYTGWDIQSMALFGGQAYFGDADGLIYSMEVGGTDNTMNYVGRMSCAFNHLKAPGYYKTVSQARAVFLANYTFTPRLSCTVDYLVNFPSPPSALDDGGSGSGWDLSLWDVGLWDEGGDTAALAVQTRWRSISRSGYSHSMQIQITMGNETAPNISLIAMDILYETGGIVV